LAARDQAQERGPDPAEDVRHAGQVAHHVVPVQPQEGKELVEYLQVLHHDHHQQRLGVGGEVHRRHGQHEDGVEVDASQVRPQPPGLAQAVGVGDVAVEGGPDQVDAGAQNARAGAAVPAGGGVPALVESG
jgi:hypothetical protein